MFVSTLVSFDAKIKVSNLVRETKFSYGSNWLDLFENPLISIFTSGSVIQDSQTYAPTF